MAEHGLQAQATPGIPVLLPKGEEGLMTDYTILDGAAAPCAHSHLVHTDKTGISSSLVLGCLVYTRRVIKTRNISQTWQSHS